MLVAAKAGTEVFRFVELQLPRAADGFPGCGELRLPSCHLKITNTDIKQTQMNILHDMTHILGFSDTIQYNTIQYNTIQYNSIQYNTIQYNTIQYNSIQFNTIQYNTIQYNTIQYNTIQYNTIQFNTIQFNSIQYNTYSPDSHRKSPESH